MLFVGEIPKCEPHAKSPGSTGTRPGTNDPLSQAYGPVYEVGSQRPIHPANTMRRVNSANLRAA